ncbi:hypothetical protein TTHERM_001345763 (macronuclear) [Tetrahymena thermophila SB210]|uniref:Uncharacterized protein n=1 Tax=Tetrahymena thermophila (strain SB210) TaxID=312017 RepID=W7WX82_TETTS|nr:hypothetical protein TTHERM_001345763 [Tetrahymena thermophila SB210]EWS71425.1 hypothetical protein TTHERM_001345763 [Tetrahymena thermophila SB210]|eukprot:XP_012656039.1 hypothetical protein TTHERM_001345763 [Tetrahymena thermophila SB210]
MREEMSKKTQLFYLNIHQQIYQLQQQIVIQLVNLEDIKQKKKDTKKQIKQKLIIYKSMKKRKINLKRNKKVQTNSNQIKKKVKIQKIIINKLKQKQKNIKIN